MASVCLQEFLLRDKGASAKTLNSVRGRHRLHGPWTCTSSRRPSRAAPEPLSTVSEPLVGGAHHEARLGSISLVTERTLVPISLGHYVKVRSKSHRWEELGFLKQLDKRA